MKVASIVYTLLCFCLIYCVQNGAALKILGLFHSSSKSHVILGQALLKGLAKHGHQVTMVSSYPLSKPIPNHRDIVMQDTKSQIFEKNNDRKEFNLFTDFGGNPIQTMLSVYEFGNVLTRLALEDPAIQKLLKSNEKFDVVISESFMNEAFYALADHFNAHLIAFSTVGTNVWTNGLVGNPMPYSYVPELFLGLTDRMTFLERVINTFACISHELIYNYVHLPKQEAFRKEFLPNTKPLSEIMQNNVSLVFLNSHTSLSNPAPLAPSMIEIGGFHIDPPQPLPADLKKILDESKQGVVYFSMGSNLKSSQLPAAKRDAFLHAFSRLKETVLWKWEEDNLPNQPKNVIIRKWFPQPDILAHPNVKLFITHGGLLSTLEAVSRGVPVLGIPVFADQNLNMQKAKALGYGELVTLDNITKESISWAVDTILTNPGYTDSIKYRSAVLNDRPLKLDEEINYWVEYVIRHNGARHLRTARNSLELYQYLLLDVIGFLLAVLLTVLLVLYFSIKFILHKIFVKKNLQANGAAKLKKKIN